MLLHAGALALLPWSMEYAPSIAKHANDPLVAQNLRDGFPNPYTLENATSFIENASVSFDTQLNLCILFENEPVGSIGVFPLNDVYKKSAEIGYWLAREQWGKGIMTEAILQATAKAFARFDIVRIHAEVFSFNTASCRVLEKCGYTHEGTKRSSIYKNGCISDSEIYAIINNRI